jgi:subtilisin family serine protease
MTSNASCTYTLRTFLVLGAALLPGCGDDLAEPALDLDDIAARIDADKVDPVDIPAPPPPPGPEADAHQNLLLKGKGKQNKPTGNPNGQYIVKLEDGADPQAAAAAVGAVPTHVFSTALRGFAGTLTAGQLKTLAKRSDVELIEPDQLVTADFTQNMDASGQPWGLDRIDQRPTALDGQYTYYRDAWGVRAYVLDTGIQSKHPEFEDRAIAVYDAWGGNGQDCHGHGTHVSGTIGGKTYGVAKQSFLRGVRVLDCNGKGTISGIIAGLDWVAANHVKPAVANMSLLSGKSTIFNAAVDNLANAGVFVAVAAGNGDADACNYSPSSASNVFTIAASDKLDNRASFSNYGACVTAYAPGVGVRSAWLNSGTASISGTSMATPHVAGAAAVYKAVHGDHAWPEIEAKLVEWATRNEIAGNPTGTPNLLLFQRY